MPKIRSLYKALCNRGSFVLLFEPQLLFPDGTSWDLVVPDAARRRMIRPLNKQAVMAGALLLPGSMAGLRFLPHGLVSSISVPMDRWAKHFGEVRERLEADAIQLAEHALDEKLIALRSHCIAGRQPFGAETRRLTKEIRAYARMATSGQLIPTEPCLCPVDVGSRYLSGLGRAARLSLSECLRSFASSSHAAAIRQIRQAIENQAAHKSLYGHCTDGLFYSRRYFSRHFRSLAVVAWCEWLGVYGDSDSLACIEKIKSMLPDKDPGRESSWRLCSRLAAIGEKLSKLDSSGRLRPGILGTI